MEKRKDGAHTCPFVSHINVSFSLVSTAAVAELESHELFKGIYSPELRRWDGGDGEYTYAFLRPHYFHHSPSPIRYTRTLFDQLAKFGT